MIIFFNLMEQEDVQISVHCRLRDQSTLVREAAVDLIGHFVLQCPHITGKYYDMIIERILVSYTSIVSSFMYLSDTYSVRYKRKLFNIYLMISLLSLLSK